MSGVLALRRAVDPLGRFLLPGACLLAIIGCGDERPPATRRVVPLALDSVPSLITLTPDRDEVLDRPLAPDGRHVAELELRPGRQYTVEVRFSGARPLLRHRDLPPVTGAEDASAGLSRTPPLPGDPEPGIARGILRPTTQRLRLEIAAPGAETQLEHLLVRRWGSAGGMTEDRATGWHTMGVYGDYRVATVLRPTEVLHWDAVVPAGATALGFDVVSDPTRPPEEMPAEGVQLLMVVTPADAAARTVDMDEGAGPGEAVLIPVRASRASWQPVSLELAGALAVEPGQRVRVSLRSRAADGLIAPGGVGVSAPVWSCTDGPRRPNLVLISLDTTRPDHLGLYGYTRDTSPNLDALAGRSAVFEAAQSTAPYTLPAHATMFSGQYPTTHGAEHPAHALDPDRTPLLAALLKDAGYATRAFTGGGYLNGDFGFAHGFDAYSNSDPVVPIEGQKVRDIEGTEIGRRYVEARRAQHWSAALDWIEGVRDVPFFLFIQTFAIHDYRPEGRHRERYDAPARGEGVTPLRKPPDQLARPYTEHEITQLVDLYDGAIHEVDALIGDLVSTLHRLGLEDDTIVVVTADHGEDFAEHLVDGQPFVGHGQGLWQTLLHVPLVVHVPWLEPRRLETRVSTVDLAPTALDLLGVPAPPAMQGRSLRSLLESGAGSVSPVVSELHSNRGAMRSLIAGELKVVTGDPAALVSWPVPAPIQLFDLGADPVELRDVGAEQRVTAEGLSETLRTFGEALEAQRTAGPLEAGLSEETRRRLEELGYVDG